MTARGVSSIHTGCLATYDVVAEIALCRAAGFDGVELRIPALAAYLDAGGSIETLRAELGPLRVTMLDVLMPVERPGVAARDALLATCDRMAAVAGALGCGAVQVVALDEFTESSWEAQRAELVSVLSDLAAVARPHGVRLAVEPVVFSPFHRLDQALEVVAKVGRDAALVLDTWHLWTTGTPWEDVAALDPALIACVQVGDTNQRRGDRWRDEDRDVLPGDGVLPLRDAVAAVAATGFAGPWSVEMAPVPMPAAALATELRARLRALTGV